MKIQLFTLFLLGSLGLPAQFFRRDLDPAKPAPAQANLKEITLSGDQQWVDTGIDLAQGDIVKLTGSGSIKLTNAKAENGPEGGPRAWTDMIRTLPVNDANRGAIVGRIGEIGRASCRERVSGLV